MFRSSHFVVLGRAGLDLYADPAGTEMEHASHFSAALGGSAANTAVAISKLGGTADLVTCVSDDAVGRYVVNELRRYGVGHNHVHKVKGEHRTSLAVVETRFENCQSVIYRNDAADFQLRVEDVDQIRWAGAGALIVTGTSLALEPSRAATLHAMELASQADVPVVLDVDYRPYSWASGAEAAEICGKAVAMSSIIIGNDVEFDVLANGGNGSEHARTVAGVAGRIVVYKRGEHGSTVFHEGRSFNLGIFQVTPLKPTGAGDSFMGGFVTGLAQGLSLQESVLRGSACAAITVTRVGCSTAVPTTAELDEFLRNNKPPIPF